jgi:hypothetical protein
MYGSHLGFIYYIHELRNKSGREFQEYCCVSCYNSDDTVLVLIRGESFHLKALQELRPAIGIERTIFECR